MAAAARAWRTALAIVGACVGLLSHCTVTEYGVGQPEQLSHGRFDRVFVYRPQSEPQRLALLLSGDGGWGLMLGEIAQRLSASGTLVAGIDVRHLLASLGQDPAACVSPGAELAELSEYLQAHYHLPRSPPVVIGHSAGATLALVALAQSPAGTFAGALTLSFCEDLDLVKPLCPAMKSTPRSGGVRLLPPPQLPGPWIALHGLDDEECPAPQARAFAEAVAGVRFVGLPGITHNYHHMERWWPQFDAAYRQLAGLAAPSAPVAQ